MNMAEGWHWTIEDIKELTFVQLAGFIDNKEPQTATMSAGEYSKWKRENKK